MTFLRAALLSLVIAIVGGANAQGQDANGAQARGYSFVTVDYADTIQGVSAMFAVRACVAEDELPVYPARAGEIPSQPPMLARVEERPATTARDIVVRVIDADGREISRHEGSTNVCGYARLAGAFLAHDRARDSRTAP